MWWLFQILIALAISYVAYLLSPKPQKPAPPAVQDLDSPTAEAGRTIPVVFGQMTVKGLNVLWFGEKSKFTYEVPI